MLHQDGPGYGAGHPVRNNGVEYGVGHLVRENGIGYGADDPVRNSHGCQGIKRAHDSILLPG